jgi:O-acetyl-ADP-ribose deacetylase (regulator of RNase III)
MIQYVVGDATNPLAPGHKIIAHVCNNIGKWGAGFVMAVSAKWPQVRDVYLEWYKKAKGPILGHVIYVRVEQHITVANMIAQHGIGTGSDRSRPIRYEALEMCLADVAQIANSWTHRSHKPAASIHMPRIGCGLGGGSWTKIEPILQRTCGHLGVVVYDLKNYDLEK